MATRTVKLIGKCSWAKVFEENRDVKGWDNEYESHDGACTINVVLDAEEYEVLKRAKSMKKGKIVDGGISVKFVRKFKGKFDWDGGAPKVLKADGSDWSYSGDGIIPNDSTVELTVSVYDTSRPSIVGTRLEEVKVLKVFEEDKEEPKKESKHSEIPF